MINWKNIKGLQEHLHENGVVVRLIDNQVKLIKGDELTAQNLIDNFNPIIKERENAIEQVTQLSALKRLEYVTDSAGKDAEYTFKAQEANQFYIDGSTGVYMQMRMDKTGETAAAVATLWKQIADGWKIISASIAAIEDDVKLQIKSENDWAKLDLIVDSARKQFEAIA